MSAPPAKWRPSLGVITAAMILSVLALPLVGLVFFRLYENQLVRQTESELIAQAAMAAAVYAQAIEGADAVFPAGPARPRNDPAVEIDERYAPIVATLDLASSPILPVRPAAAQAARTPAPEALGVGAALTPVLAQTQRTTLAGFRLLTAEGVVIGGREDIGLSFAHLPEVRAAMAGRFSAVLRMREEDEPPPPLYSISRGTKIRVFVAFPVFVGERVRGVVYVSRTPDNILRNLYREREKVLAAVALALCAALVIGAVFVRTVARPVRELSARAEAIAGGRSEAIGPLKRHGTRELAQLTDTFMAMARRLSDRSDYLSGFANHVSHELKSPLTAIRGAAELIRDGEAAMTPSEREHFLSNVLADVARIEALLERLRELARADNPSTGGVCDLAAVVAGLGVRFEGLELTLDAAAGLELPMSEENAEIVFSHLLDNARRHGASAVRLSAMSSEGRIAVRIADNGEGISPGNRARIFDPFFTSRRAEGGTGMGLGVVRALLRAHGGEIELDDFAPGACFVLQFPAT